jgi:hypothetical protein
MVSAQVQLHEPGRYFLDIYVAEQPVMMYAASPFACARKLVSR